jgi:uncharacterized protein (DUF427 family)
MQDLMTRAREQLRHEPIERRVRASAGAEPIADSTRALLVWEPRRICPSYAVPAGDIRGELGEAPLTNGHVDGVLHPGIPFSVHTAAGEPVTVGGRAGAGFRLADEDIEGYVVLDFDAFDWLEEDEPIYGHPRDPYHRVDVRLSMRPVRIEIDGEILAETTRARLLCETNLPMRFYVPREDVRAELRDSEFTSYCPYKGRASWFSIGPHADLGWSYEQPVPELAAIGGLVAFWDERVDVFIAGERRGRPDSLFSKVLQEEFAT